MPDKVIILAFLNAITDTKDTAGSSDSSSKLFLIGAPSQATNPKTYSHDTAYVGTDGCLYSGSKKVLADLRTKSVSFSNPTNGVVDTGLSRSSYLVIGAYCSDRNGWDCCINSGSSSKWYVRIFDAKDSSVISGSGTLEVFYIPL